MNNLEKFGNKLLNDLNIKYINEFPIGKFFADIYVPKYNLVIEWYGDYWHNFEGQKVYDKKRIDFIKAKGYKVLIFWESDIYKNTNLVIEKIQFTLNNNQLKLF